VRKYLDEFPLFVFNKLNRKLADQMNTILDENEIELEESKKINFFRYLSNVSYISFIKEHKSENELYKGLKYLLDQDFQLSFKTLASAFYFEEEDINGITFRTTSFRNSKHSIISRVNSEEREKLRPLLQFTTGIIDITEEYSGWSRNECKSKLSDLIGEISKTLNRYHDPRQLLVKNALDFLKGLQIPKRKASCIVHDILLPFIPNFTSKEKFMGDHDGADNSEWRQYQEREVMKYINI